MRRKEFILGSLGLLLLGCKKKNMARIGIGIGTNKSGGIQSILGTLVSNDFNSANWTQTGAASTFDFSSGTKCAISGGVSDLGNFTIHSRYVANDNVVITGDFRVKTLGVGASGVMIGFQAWNASGAIGNSLNQLACSASRTRGWTYNAQVSTIGEAAPVFPAPILNDLVRLRVTRVANVDTYEAWNLTNGVDYAIQSYTHTLTYPLGSYSSLPSTRPCILSVAGSYDLEAWDLRSTDNTNTSVLCIGDSKTFGKGIVSISNRYARNSTKSNTVSACGGDETAQVVSRMSQFAGYHTTNAILWIGCNDVANGVSSGTWQANYLSIVTALQNAGMTVYNLYSAPESRFNASSVLNPWIAANTPNPIDIYTPLLGAGSSLNAAYDCGDGIHPNTAGNVVIYNTIHAAYPNLL